MLKRFTTSKFAEALKWLVVRQEESEPAKRSTTKAESLVKLHEYQHRVIVGLFRINLAGLVAFLLVVVSFTLFTLTDPSAPRWLGLMMFAVTILLLLGLVRTVLEFRRYTGSYKELMGQLQGKLRKFFQRRAEGTAGTRKTESGLLASLKPQEYKGWDAKSCPNCHKTIELLSALCQHCGHEQDDKMVN